MLYRGLRFVKSRFRKGPALLLKEVHMRATNKREKMNKLKKSVVFTLWTCSNALLMAPVTDAYASANASSNQAVNGIHTLISLACNIVSAIGGFVTLWGIFEFGNAMQQHDAAQQGQAGKRLAGGIVMIAAPQLLKLFFNM